MSRPDRFTVADISVGYALMVLKVIGLFDQAPASLQAYYGRLRQRPGLRAGEGGAEERGERKGRRADAAAQRAVVKTRRGISPSKTAGGKINDPGHRTGQLVPSARLALARAKGLAFRGTHLDLRPDAEVDRGLRCAAAALGVGKGERVAFLGLNQPMFFFVMFAAARLGAIFVPLNFRLTGPELAFMIEDCAATRSDRRRTAPSRRRAATRAANVAEGLPRGRG